MAKKRQDEDVINGAGSNSNTYPDGTHFGSTLFDQSGSSGNNWTYFQDNTDYLLGKVLTVIDATYSNPTQCNAVKELIKDVFRDYRTPRNWTVNTGDNGTLPYYTTGTLPLGDSGVTA